MSASTSGTITNNIFYGSQQIVNSVYRNNISYGTSSTTFSAIGCNVSHNIGAGPQYISYNDSNMVYVDMNTVFVNSGSPDANLN